MLIIPMWLEIEFTKKDNEELISARYSPVTKTWWWQNWEITECHRDLGIKSEIHNVADLFEAEEQIKNDYKFLESCYDNHGFEYWWCEVDNHRVQVQYGPYFPDTKDSLPWNASPEIYRDTENFDNKGYQFFYDKNSASCSMFCPVLTTEQFFIVGVIRYPQILVWRNIFAKKGSKTKSGEPIYRFKVNQWKFYNDEQPRCIGQNPYNASLYRPLGVGEVLTDNMTDDEIDRTALSIFMHPDPTGECL